MEDLLLEIKPKYITFVRSLSDIKKKLPIIFGSEFLVLMGLNAYIMITQDEFLMNLIENKQVEFAIYIYLLMMILIIIFTPIVITIFNFFDKKNFEVTSYRVYNDRIDLREGFINYKNNVILFKDIKEIHLKQNFIQKRYNLGTIELITEANNSNPNSINSGICMVDLENSNDIYEKLKELHERGM